MAELKIGSPGLGEEYCWLCFHNIYSAVVYGSVNFSRNQLSMHLKLRVVWEGLDTQEGKTSIIAKQAILACFIFSKYGNSVSYLSTCNNSPDLLYPVVWGLFFPL